VRQNQINDVLIKIGEKVRNSPSILRPEAVSVSASVKVLKQTPTLVSLVHDSDRVSDKVLLLNEGIRFELYRHVNLLKWRISRRDAAT
jgi:hypothetical protein